MAVAERQANNGAPVPRYIREPLEHRFDFSFCTLVADEANYARFLASAHLRGFTKENSEFFALDNREENRFDGFNALRRVLPECSGRYVVFTHDDVEFTEDGAQDLKRVLEELTRTDPNWRLAGNAGAVIGGRGSEVVVHITDPDHQGRVDAPVRVQSLDENFFLMRRSSPIPNSFDLEGFHLYASDLCLINEVLGGHAYVVPFMVTHHSGGESSEAFKKVYGAFFNKYRRYMKGRHFTAPCGEMNFGWRSMFNKIEEKRRLSPPGPPRGGRDNKHGWLSGRRTE